MEETVEWRHLRVTRAGVLVYEMLWTPGAQGYGARIASRGQCAEVRGVTANRQQMQQWMYRMARGGVRPCHLRDVLEELLLAEDPAGKNRGRKAAERKQKL